jgi:hypothetical protein
MNLNLLCFFGGCAWCESRATQTQRMSRGSVVGRTRAGARETAISTDEVGTFRAGDMEQRSVAGRTRANARGGAISTDELGTFRAGDMEQRTPGEQLAEQRARAASKWQDHDYSLEEGTVEFEPSRCFSWPPADSGGLCGINALATIVGPVVAGAAGAERGADRDGSSSADQLAAAASELRGLRGFVRPTAGEAAGLLVQRVAAGSGAHLVCLPRSSGGWHWAALFPSRGTFMDRHGLTIVLPSGPGLRPVLVAAGYKVDGPAGGHVEVRLRQAQPGECPQPSMLQIVGKRRKRKIVLSAQIAPYVSSHPAPRTPAMLFAPPSPPSRRRPLQVCNSQAARESSGRDARWCTAQIQGLRCYRCIEPARQPSHASL